MFCLESDHGIIKVLYSSPLTLRKKNGDSRFGIGCLTNLRDGGLCGFPFAGENKASHRKLLPGELNGLKKIGHLKNKWTVTQTKKQENYSMLLWQEGLQTATQSSGQPRLGNMYREEV